MPRFIPNVHTSEVVLSPTSHMENSSDPRIELHYHANVVVLVSNSFVFELTGITCNAQPFASDLGIAKTTQVTDVALACEFL